MLSELSRKDESATHWVRTAARCRWATPLGGSRDRSCPDTSTVATARLSLRSILRRGNPPLSLRAVTVWPAKQSG